jgi:hypothetical protein
MNDGKVSLGLATTVRVTLKDGTFHDDIGYGIATNVRSKGEAFEKARKEASTDGLKRALKNFGPIMGNCLYDKDFVKKVTKLKADQAGPLDVNSIFRRSDFRSANPDVNDAPYKIIKGLDTPAPPEIHKLLDFEEFPDELLIAGDVENMDPAILTKTSPGIPNAPNPANAINAPSNPSLPCIPAKPMQNEIPNQMSKQIPNQMQYNPVQNTPVYKQPVKIEPVQESSKRPAEAVGFTPFGPGLPADKRAKQSICE